MQCPAGVDDVFTGADVFYLLVREEIDEKGLYITGLCNWQPRHKDTIFYLQIVQEGPGKLADTRAFVMQFFNLK